MGDEEYGFPVDVFAYGMLLYAMITEQPPFPGVATPFQLAQKIVAGERPLIPPFVSPFYRDLITSCWDQQPSARPTFAHILERADGFMLDGCDKNAFNHYRQDVLKMTSRMAY
jgi:serine/threonine protein kinase